MGCYTIISITTLASNNHAAKFIQWDIATILMHMIGIGININKAGA